jgi:hypothetical protein
MLRIPDPDEDDEQTLIAVTRDQVMRRDYQGCRACVVGVPRGGGADTWAHMSGHRRSQTRNLPPAARHATAWTLRLCMVHHVADETHQLRIVALSDRGADGPLRYLYKGQTWEES